jgi:calcineurin-like phosphoesterase
VVGTHTHVRTADARVLPGGTAYLTDAGMTGPVDGVIGVRKELAIERFLRQTPNRFEVAAGETRLQGAYVDVDERTGRATAIEPVDLLVEVG